MLAPGTVIGGDFVVERLLQEGGMGAVYIAEQRSTGKRRALKVMHDKLAPDARSRERFADEAKVGGRIPSEHVVEVIAAGVDEDRPWLAMELLQGEDLEARVQRGPLEWPLAVSLFGQLGHALEAAHARGIIHRDLKPENLFLCESRRHGASVVLKVLDFGIAASVAGSRQSVTVTSAIGSPLFMAPEQATPGAKLSPATDVWALGLIAFYALTGRHYWRSGNENHGLQALLGEVMVLPLEPASLRAHSLGAPGRLPAEFDAWLDRCLRRPAHERFPTAGPAIHALCSLLAGAGAPRAAAPALSATAPLAPHQVPSFPGHSAPGWEDRAAPSPRRAGPISQGGSDGPVLQAPRSSGRAAVWLMGGLGALALIGLMIGGAFMLGDDEEPALGPVGERPVDSSPDDSYETALSACRSALARRDAPAALTHARAALETRPGDEAARACQVEAQRIRAAEDNYQLGLAHLNRGQREQAYSRFDSLPEDSPLRERPEVRSTTRAVATSRLAAGRTALARDPTEARRTAELVLAMRDIAPEQRAEAERLRADANARESEPHAEPERPRADARGPAVRSEARAETRGGGDGDHSQAVRQCAMNGDNACVIRLLEGRARTQQDLALLIEAYRARSQNSQALRHMRTYVQRYPDTPRANQYRQLLARQDGPAPARGPTIRPLGGGSTSPQQPSGPPADNPF